MGYESNIGLGKMPKQGRFLGAEVIVCFNYDTSKTIEGVIVRDDAEAPGISIIQLTDCSYVLTTECQYRAKY